MSELSYIFRPAVPDDMPFLFATWLKSYVPTTPIARRFAFDGHHQVISDIIRREDTEEIVACHPEVTSMILGWACRSGDVLHYVFVRGAARRQGLAKQFAAQITGIKWLSHMTPDGARIAKLWPGSACNPYLAFGPQYGEKHVA